jgi:protein-S-isoprenylcysteine O-methyltransferase
MDAYFEITFIVVCILWLGSELAVTFSRRAEDATAQLRDSRSLMVINITIYGSIILAAWVRTFRGWHFGVDLAYLKWIGLGLIVIGICIKWLSVFTLRKFFTVNVAVFNDHQLISHGLYRYVRHPSYFGVLISFFGLGLAFRSWLSVVALVLPIALAFLWRIRVEEASMCDAFPDGYAAYRKRTSMLIPFVL